MVHYTGKACSEYSLDTNCLAFKSDLPFQMCLLYFSLCSVTHNLLNCVLMGFLNISLLAEPFRLQYLDVRAGRFAKFNGERCTDEAVDLMF